MVKITKFFTETPEGEAYLDAVPAPKKKRRAGVHRPSPQQRAQVEALSGHGIKQEDIAAYIGVSKETLRKHYRKQLDMGKITATAAVAQTLYVMAKSGKDFQATKFWLLQRAKDQWSEVSRHEINIADLREHARRRAYELGITEEEAAEIVAGVERAARNGDL